jgi:hypothetical protein
MADPFVAGAVQDNAMFPVFAATAERATTADGAPPGVAVATMPAPFPAEVIARTRNQYCVPFVRPETAYVNEDAGTALETVVKPETALEIQATALVVHTSMMYEVIESPPVLAGAVHVMTAVASCGAATREAGAAAVVNGRAEVTAYAPVPAALTAAMR